jgi:hypothetical protein
MTAKLSDRGVSEEYDDDYHDNEALRRGDWNGPLLRARHRDGACLRWFVLLDALIWGIVCAAVW